MYFCEKCNLLMQDNICEQCGKKKLREVQDDDFCYYINLPSNHAKYFEENLQLQNIPVALLGKGLDLRTRTSSTYNIFVPYGYFGKATEVYHMLWGQQGIDCNELLKNLQFRIISPKKHAENLKEIFFNNPELWYERITPASVAEELRGTTKGDYSEIWDDHCVFCYKPIDKNTTENFYLSEDEFTWVCKDCFEKLKEQFNFKVR